MSHPQREEQEIEAARKDPRRFTVLYERYFNDVFRFLLRRAGNRDLASDLTQEAFLKALLALPKYQQRGLPLRAWLYRIALNELRMHWRKKKEIVIDMSFNHVKGLSEEMELRLDEDDMQRLARALGRLDEARAQLIQLRYMDGLSFLEVGQVLGIGEDAAKMRTHRTLGVLRNYLSNGA